MAGLYRLEESLTAAGLGPVAGADEAGRGACAGPLVAAAVVLPGRPRLRGLADSKELTRAARERMYPRILERALAWSVVVVGPAECDRVGIQEANLQALRRAVWKLDVVPGFALTDGFPVPGLAIPALAVWKGDQVSASVAAASIIAKVSRDRLMVGLAERYPGYGFDVHMGYATQAHERALAERGPCATHRRSYANVQRAARLTAS